MLVNANKLRGKIVERGMNVSSVSVAIGLNKSTCYRKLSGDCPFTIQDADKLVDVLNLTADDAKSIFFSQIVAQTRQSD